MSDDAAQSGETVQRYCPCNLWCHTESESPCSMDCYAHHGEVIGGEWPAVEQSHPTPWPGPCTAICVDDSGSRDGAT